MLGYITTEGRGAADRLLAEVAAQLRAEGWQLAGAVQVNCDRTDGLPRDMNLHVLTGADVVRISQNLGAGSRGCRLDAAGLEQAVGLVATALGGRPQPRLVIVNKFGMQEAEGRGFRPVIGQALAQGIPVLIAVGADNLAAFEAFAGGLAAPVVADLTAILGWCRGASV